VIASLRAAVVLCVSLTELEAQAGGAVLGTVTSSDGGVPLPFARVSVMGTKLTTLTRVDGWFTLAQVAAGTHVLQIRLDGYSTIMTAVDIAEGDTVQIVVTLAPAAVVLPPVEITAKPAPRLPAMQGFEERRERAQGHFFNREEIVRMQPRRFTDVLRRVPGVQLQHVSGPYEQGEAVRMSRTIGVMGPRPCPVLYYVNGSPFPVAGDLPIDQYINPDEVAAIEVYSGMSQIPSEFNSTSHNARCGVIVIWTLTSLDSVKTKP
jgi:hypothetical protein